MPQRVQSGQLTLLMTLLMAICLTATGASANSVRLGILNQPAPAWSVTDWLHLPKGKTTLDISDFKGKVVYLYCFQSWCPGCHSHGFPTLQKLTRHYADATDIAFVAVQTTFEGYSINTFDKAKTTMEQYQLTIPTGQSGDREAGSKLMRNYRTGGTPWTIIIDKAGVVRYNNFHIDPDKAVQFLDWLRQQSM